MVGRKAVLRGLWAELPVGLLREGGEKSSRAAKATPLLSLSPSSATLGPGPGQNPGS